MANFRTPAIAVRNPTAARPGWLLPVQVIDATALGAECLVRGIVPADTDILSEPDFG